MEELKCSCGGSAKRVDDIKYKGFRLSGWRCKKCREELVDPQQANLYLKYARLKKEGKLRVKLRKVGNSFAVSIPATVRELLDLKEGEELSLELTESGMVVKTGT